MKRSRWMIGVMRMPAIVGIACWISVTSARADSEVVERTVQVQMRDGVFLEAVLTLPAETGEFPAILVRTPYGKGQHLDEARFWAQNGYAVVVQDARGKWGSGGEYVPFLNEYADGSDTLDWIVAQRWSDGRVGMWGSSYLAFCQLVLASKRHQALKSIMPISGWIQDDGQIRHGGAHHIMLSIPWILHEEAQTKRSLRDFDLYEMFEFLPLIDVFDSIGLKSKIWTEEFDFSHLDAYSAGDINVPSLHITGWNDFVCGASLGAYGQAVQGDAGPSQKLMVGPWFHDQYWTTYTQVGDEDFGPSSAMGRERLMKLSLEWFDRSLSESTGGFSEWPPVRLFVMGANEWKDYDRWPPKDVSYRKLFLGSEKGANGLAGDGYLSARAPETSKADTYQFDPMDPVPTYGGANFHFLPHLIGVKDQREIEERDDVLVYTTPPLEEEAEIIGPIRAELYASTEGPDTDFTAKLVEVRSNGYARIIQEGIIRASYRNGGDRELIEPGQIYRLAVDLGSTAVVIPKGHRLRLEISSSNFPKYDRNPNTGEEALMARVLKSVTQSVYHGGDHPSYLEIPVMKQKGE